MKPVLVEMFEQYFTSRIQGKQITVGIVGEKIILVCVKTGDVWEIRGDGSVSGLSQIILEINKHIVKYWEKEK